MKRKLFAAGAAILVLGLLASEAAWAGGGHRSPGGHGFARHGSVHGQFRGHTGSHFSGHSGVHFKGHVHGAHGHRHSGVHIGAVIGVPAGGHWTYRAPPTYVYSYPPVVVSQAPPVYIERIERDRSSPLDQPPASYWLYCRNPQGYYPNVRDCQENWQTVPAQPE